MANASYKILKVYPKQFSGSGNYQGSRLYVMQEERTRNIYLYWLDARDEYVVARVNYNSRLDPFEIADDFAKTGKVSNFTGELQKRWGNGVSIGHTYLEVISLK